MTTIAASWIFYCLASRGLKRAVKKILLLLEAIRNAGWVDYLYDKKGEPVSVILKIPKKGDAPPHENVTMGESTNVKLQNAEKKEPIP